MRAQKIISGAVIGAAAGVAFVFFLQTKKGQEFLANLKNKAGRLGETLSENVEKLADISGIENALTHA